MDNKEIPFAEKSIEAKLSQIGSEIVMATEKTFAAKKLNEEANMLLMDAQTEIADLYESLGDLLKKSKPKRHRRRSKLRAVLDILFHRQNNDS